jgi:hypothetical protein
LGLGFCVTQAAPTLAQITLTQSQIEDRVRGGWVGQMVGVTWRAPTEFRYLGRTIPANEVPTWYPSLINDAFAQDDMYVEIPFLDTMVRKGVNASWVDYGNSFRDSNFLLFEANQAGWNNLRSGIPAPWSGHFSNNNKWWAIDWQIESNYIGAITPGQRSAAIDLAWRTGHVMNYGDGVYGGVAMAAMQAEAFVATSLDQILQAGRQSVPVGSDYRAVVDDVFNSHQAGKTWEQTWQLLETKWANTHPSIFGHNGQTYDVTAILNGGYVFMGLLYGQGDFTESMRIAMRGGQDSDCNPSSVAAILGTYMGLSAIPNTYKSALNTNGLTFAGSTYTFNDSIEASMDLAAELLVMSGGSISGEGANAIWTIPIKDAPAPLLERVPPTGNTAPVLDAQITLGKNRQVTFSSLATDPDGILQYQWYFGDTTYQNGAAGTHTYNVPGQYTAICYVTDGVGQTAWRSFVLDVESSIQIPSLMVNFSDLGSGEGSLPSSYRPAGTPAELGITWNGWQRIDEFVDRTPGSEPNRHIYSEITNPSIVFSELVIVDSLWMMHESVWGQQGIFSVQGLLDGEVIWSYELNTDILKDIYVQVVAGQDKWINALRFSGAVNNYIDDLHLTTEVVPEPALLAFLATAGLLLRRRRC